MNSKPPTCLVILAGGQSTRMGIDKAIIAFKGQRLIDRLVSKFAGKADLTLLSAAEDYGTGLTIIRDDPNAPGGPVGGIFSVAARLHETHPEMAGFVTLPVDAPYAPADLVERLTASGICTVAEDHQRIHPTFAYWRCDMINNISQSLEQSKRSPSLQWLAREAGADKVTWSDEQLFMNINRPEDLVAAERHKKAGA
ncbi:MAG: molybdenum cofactor guanylyltransferase [Parasphingorhabdus sp.]|uniref:molybdenum cofactor guanylyltransferase n=2 Tax=Parasphingorhabdus sp. TaxID=2709688 RepID=UPI003264F857